MTNQNESQKLMLRESVAHKRMDEEFAEATKAVDALYAELDDLRAYKELAIELANRKGYDSLAGVFDDWEKHNLEQQAKGVESLISKCIHCFGPWEDVVCNDLGISQTEIKDIAKQLRKKAEEL